MRIAFYAPLKAPDHPIPSGDRHIAQLLIAGLRRAGHDPVLASRLRSYDGQGDPVRQHRIAGRGKTVAAGLIERWRREPDRAPRLWFTYHLYYKAPDWLGPTVSTALGIPYVVAEASCAGKRAEGPWHCGHAAVEQALRRADLVIGLNSADRAGVLPLLGDARRWMAMRPFLDAAAYRPAPAQSVGPVRLITVAMMRPGDKLASYRLLGEALARVLDLPWSIEVIGDGPARTEVIAALAPLGSRVTFGGALPPQAVAERLAAADLFVWPAINEAFGMALLEAQACGLPVIAGASGGVGDIVAAGVTGLLPPPGDAVSFAAAARQLVGDGDARRAMGIAARRKVLEEHDLGPASRILSAALDSLVAARAA